MAVDDDDRDRKELERWTNATTPATGGTIKKRCYRYTPGSPLRMIDFIFLDHTHLSLPYSRLASIRYDMSKGIDLNFGNTLIRVRGRDLIDLHFGLLEFCVGQIEAREVLDDFDEDVESEVVTDIELNPEN